MSGSVALETALGGCDVDAGSTGISGNGAEVCAAAGATVSGGHFLAGEFRTTPLDTAAYKVLAASSAGEWSADLATKAGWGGAGIFLVDRACYRLHRLRA